MSTSAAATAAADFAQPIYLEEENANGQAAAGTGSSSSPSLDSVAPVLNLDDPNLLLAEVETNQDANPYAIPPPLPDGRWLVKIKQRDVKDQQGQPARYKVDQISKGPRAGTVYAFTALDATVIDPTGKWDGIVLSDYFVSTLPNERKGNAIPLSWILGCLKVQLPAKINAKTLLDEFFKATAGEPMLEIDTVWEGGLAQEDQERFEQAGERQPRVLGQHRFPQTAKGESLPDMDIDTKLGKVHLHARPRINGYYPVGSAKAAGMELGPRAK
jgi:hypothetical protein